MEIQGNKFNNNKKFNIDHVHSTELGIGRGEEGKDIKNK